MELNMKDRINQTYRKLIVDTGIEMLEKGITVGTWGNISARDPETGLIYISPSGMDYVSIKPEHVVVMDSELKVIDGAAEPSIEKHMHVAVFNAREDVNAVIHTHPVYSSAFGAVEKPLPGISEDFIQIIGAEVQVAQPYELPGTPELGVSAVKGLGMNNAVLLPGHGALIAGTDMKMALKVSLVLEKNAQIYLYAKMLGGDIRSFRQNEIDFMQDFARNSYGKKNSGI